MKQTWTLHVENFGKIKEASIDVRPFMIFAGENNSGKSYLMSLLWGLLNAEDELFEEVDFSTETAQRCMQWIEKKLIQLKGSPFIVDDEGQDLLVTWFNEVLTVRKDWLVYRIFNRRTPVGVVRVSQLKTDSPFRIVPLSHQSGWICGEELLMPDAEFLLNRSDNGNMIYTLRKICWHFFTRDLYRAFTGPTYLPASRTGFMLTYKTLVKEAIKHGYGAISSASQTTLNWPTNKFLQVLANLGLSARQPYSVVGEYLQQHVLGGQITHEDTPVPTYRYKPIDGREELPFHATSSLVSELAPLVLYLQSFEELTALIIEEPEAHLHLEMQKKIAIALARLVNLGLPVWITTHSDTMAQQINNLIQLHNHPNRAELASQFGYDEATDFLDPNLVSAYQFSVKQDGTEVEKLPLTPGGIAFPTFTNSIIAQAKQTLAFGEVTDDEEQD